jgi:hypothetical protein
MWCGYRYSNPPLTPLSAKCPQPVNLTGMLFLELGPCEGDVVSSNPVSTQGVELNPYLLSTRTRYPVDRVAVLRMTFEVGFLPAVGVDSTARRSACKLVAFVSHVLSIAGQLRNGASDGSRTRTGQDLNLVPLPIGLQTHVIQILSPYPAGAPRTSFQGSDHAATVCGLGE